MLILAGTLIVFAASIGGFMLAGGNPLVLLHVSEFVVILGIATGMLVIASPKHILIETLHKMKEAISGKSPGEKEFTELLKLLYELFTLGRRQSLMAVEEHISDPAKSSIFQRYPGVLRDQTTVTFLCNSLKPVIDGKIKPDHLEELLAVELEARINESDHPVHMLQLVGDSLPGIGIVAAVLGIINTMAAISDGPEKVGERVAAALTGTLLGIFLAYGFVNPFAARVKFNNGCHEQFLGCVSAAVIAFAKGLPPATAVEVARRSLDTNVQPKGEGFEAALKALTAASGK